MSLTQSEFGSALPWPADRPERWPIERLIPYANNARIHTEADLAKIIASIARWGWTMPVLADEDGVLIAGHLRIRAAVRLGLDSVPVVVARGWSGGGEARLSGGRQSTGGTGKLGGRFVTRRAARARFCRF